MNRYEVTELLESVRDDDMTEELLDQLAYDCELPYANSLEVLIRFSKSNNGLLTSHCCCRDDLETFIRIGLNSRNMMYNKNDGLSCCPRILKHLMITSGDMKQYCKSVLLTKDPELIKMLIVSGIVTHNTNVPDSSKYIVESLLHNRPLQSEYYLPSIVRTREEILKINDLDILAYNLKINGYKFLTQDEVNMLSLRYNLPHALSIDQLVALSKAPVNMILESIAVEDNLEEYIRLDPYYNFDTLTMATYCGPRIHQYLEEQGRAVLYDFKWEYRSAARLERRRNNLPSSSSEEFSDEW